MQTFTQKVIKLLIDYEIRGKASILEDIKKLIDDEEYKRDKEILRVLDEFKQ